MSASNVFRAAFQRAPKRSPPPQVVLLEFDRKAKQGEDLRITAKIRNAPLVRLNVSQGDLDLFSGIMPPSGSVMVHVLTPDDIEIELTADNLDGVTETNRWQITPKATPPKFRRIKIPAKIWLGETILSSWRALRATGVGVEVETADGTQQRIGKPVDAFLLTPRAAGRVIFRFFLKGQHTTIFDTRVVEVVARKPLIDLKDAVQSAPVGQEVTFQWSTRDATQVWLEARGKRQMVGLSGMIIVKVERDAEGMTLIARGPGGITPKLLSVHPRHFGGLD